MATIERVIDGKTWIVNEDGAVWWRGPGDSECCIERGRLMTKHVATAKTAIALYEEWQQLKAQEGLDAPPRVELPEGWSFKQAVRPDWFVATPTGHLCLVSMPGTVSYEANRLCNLAADELAARRPAAEHETRGAK